MIESNSGERKLLCSFQLWNYGTQAGGRSFTKSITNYRWQTGNRDIPKKDGVHDHACDALRYWVINARWESGEAKRAAASAFKKTSDKPSPVLRPGDFR
jgi:hypothetical protein